MTVYILMIYLPFTYCVITRKQSFRVLISLVGLRRHSFDHPTAELGHQLEPYFVHLLL
jgi:hypothetical protein